jgi:hypothetical protein
MRSTRAHLELAVLVVVAVALASCGGHSGQPAARPSQSSGVFGIVLLCPHYCISATASPPPLPGGFGNGWGMPCSKASVRVVPTTRANAGREVVTVKPDAQGLFRLALSPGRYVLWLVPHVLGVHTTITVRAGAYTRVELVI